MHGVGTGKTITITGYTAPSANYTVSQPTGLTADITKLIKQSHLGHCQIRLQLQL